MFYKQVNDGNSDIVDSLQNHPNVKQVTPHKKVTRTLKYVKGWSEVA